MLPQRPQPASKSRYRWTRDLHLYAGLFVSPFVLVYAVSALLLVHAYLPWGGRTARPTATRTEHVAVRDVEDGLAVAAQVRDQIGVRGEIGYVAREPGSPTLSFPVESPGRMTSVKVGPASGIATIEAKETGAWAGLVWLHKMTGPHNANIRGNWVFTRLWGWLADASVYLLLFRSVSGIYLWVVLRAERKTGLVALGAGMLSFGAIALALVA